jgi:hypothetical protein
MICDVTTRGQIEIGPPEAARLIPRTARVRISHHDPYDIDVRLAWEDGEQRLVPAEVRIAQQPGGPGVRIAEVAGLKLGHVIPQALIAAVLDDRGWRGVVEDHDAAASPAVDALVYAMAHALGGLNPTQTVALARGLQPGSAIKRVMKARELGYLGEATKGRSGGLATDTVP